MRAPFYATRESVMSALDVQATARRRRQIDDALEAATDLIDANCHRQFYPQIGTRYYDWPTSQLGTTWRLWLDENEVVEVDAVTTGGQTAGITLDPSQYVVGDAGGLNAGPPYDQLSINLAAQSSAAFQITGTFQRSVAITGTFVWPASETQAADLDESISDTDGALVLSNSAEIGVGDLIRMDNERMVVTEKRQVDTGATLAADLAGTANAQSITITGDPVFEDEIIMIDGEKLLVVEVAGSTCLVVRAYDGTALAAHTTGAALYAPRRAEIERGVAGTIAAPHTESGPVYLHKAPGQIRELCRALAIMTILAEPAGYARVAGSGDNERQVSPRQVISKADDVYELFGRGSRIGAV
jgi:hypothetical protein